jgi:hypothetical protein
MKSNLSIWHDVETGKLDPQKALKQLEKLPGGGSDTQAYRRIKKFIGNKQKPKVEEKVEEPVVVEEE